MTVRELVELSDRELGIRLAEVLDQVVDAEYRLGPRPSRQIGPLLLEARRRGWIGSQRSQSSSEKRNEREEKHVPTG